MPDAEITKNPDFFRILVETMQQMVWITLPDGKAIYNNRQWQEYTGIGVQEALDCGWLSAFHPDDVNRIQPSLNFSLSSGHPFLAEARLKRHDGEYHWWLIRGQAIRDDSQTIVRWIGTCTDIDQLKVAVERLTVDEALISDQLGLINLAQDAILMKDLNGVIRFWNKGAERLFGWTALEAIGQKNTDLYVDDLEKNECVLQTLFKIGHWEGALTKKNKAGQKIRVETRLTLSRDENGKPKSILSISSDLTERENLQAQTIRAQRMESIGTLAGGIAHDMNNVLGPIVLAMDLLKLGECDPKKAAIIETIELCALRGTAMVGKLLAFARGVEGDRKEICPDRLLKDVRKIVINTFLKSFEVSLNSNEGLWTFMGDVTQIHQVLINLCVNARDAMPHGGKLSISGENVSINEQNVSQWGDCKLGNYVCLMIEDTGSGMSAETLSRVFEPFFTTKEIGKGTGLGLSTSLAIVKSHGGFMRVVSEEGVGTRFGVFLPSRDDTLDSTAGSKTNADEVPKGEGQRILVIDDEIAVRQIMGETLESFGYQVILADGGAQALKIYADEMQTISLVITDMMMPEMNGVATLKALRKLNPSLIAIACSGLNSSFEASNEKYSLSKPFTANQLLKCVQEALSPKC